MASVNDKVGGRASLTPVGQNVQTLNARLDSEMISSMLNRIGRRGNGESIYNQAPFPLNGSREQPYSLFEGSLCFTFNTENSPMRKPATPLVLAILNGIAANNVADLYQKISFVGVALSHVDYKGPDTRNPIDVAVQHGGTTSIVNNGGGSIAIGEPLVWKLPDRERPNPGSNVFELQVTTIQRETYYLQALQIPPADAFASISQRWFATSLNSTDPGEIMHIRLK